LITKNRRSLAITKRSLCTAAVLAALGSAPVSAFIIDTGSPDLSLNLDTTVRYNIAWRIEDVNPDFANAYGSDETELVFDQGDIISNRADVLVESDLTYKYFHGIRVSAAAWNEEAYDKVSETNPEINALFGPFAPPSNYKDNGNYSNYTKRYITGHSGEILDAFAFTRLDIGSSVLSIKGGKLTQFWGNSLFDNADAISNQQAPIDAIKGQSSPGSETKELFLPIKQVLVEWQPSAELVVKGNYYFDWEPYRVSPGGTYYSAGDSGGALDDPYPMCAAVFPGSPLTDPPTPPFCLGYGASVVPDDNKGDFGIAAKWTPKWFIDDSGQGTIGFFYRKYDERLPWSFTELTHSEANIAIADFTHPEAAIRLSFARDTKLYGISVDKNINPFGLGFEMSLRQDTALNSAAGALVHNVDFSTGFPFQSRELTYANFEGARGDTWHFLVNGLKLLDRTPIWETGTVLFELGYQRLDKVTKNAGLFIGEGYAGCPAGRDDKSGCASEDSLVFSWSFSPQWLSVFPGLDITVPMSLTYNVFGTSPALGGTSEGAYNWSVGVQGTYHLIYFVTLKYADSHNDYWTKISDGSDGYPGRAIKDYSSGSSPIANDHGWLSLTFKTTF